MLFYSSTTRLLNEMHYNKHNYILLNICFKVLYLEKKPLLLLPVLPQTRNTSEYQRNIRWVFSREKLLGTMYCEKSSVMKPTRGQLGLYNSN